MEVVFVEGFAKSLKAKGGHDRLMMSKSRLPMPHDKE
jgi:hypothetical protein